MRKRYSIIIAITGATGSIIGCRILEHLRQRDDVETHLVISAWGRRTLEYETSMRATELEALADHVYKPNDMWSPIASGSFQCDAMVVVPCSMRTLASIATGISDNLISRAADVMLKERKNLVLVPRETPLSSMHLENIRALARLVVVSILRVLTFYNRPNSIEDMIAHLVQRILDQLGIHEDLAPRWEGHNPSRQ